MGLNNYPYTNFHELNADWILEQLKEEKAKVLALETWKTGTDDEIEDLTNRLTTVESFISDIESGIVPQDFLDSLMAYVQDNFDTLAEPLQQAVDSLRTDLTTAQNTINRMKHLKNAKYIIIGDSYGQGYSPETPSGGNGWCIQLVNILGLSSNQYIIEAEGGAGFSSERPYTYNSLLDRCAADSTVDYIIVAGGSNDTQSTDSLIYTGITSFMNTAKTKFPNAKVFCGMIGWDGDNSYRSRFFNVYKAYNEGIVENGGYYLNNTECVLHDMSLLSSTDLRHATVSGNRKIADAIIECLECGSCNIDIILGFDITAPSNGGTITNGNISTLIHNHQLNATHNNIIVNWATPISFNGEEGSSFEVCTIPDTSPLWAPFNAPYTFTGTALLRVRNTGSSTYYFMYRPISLWLTYNNLNKPCITAKFVSLNDAGNNYQALDIQRITILSNSLTQDIIKGI